MENLLIGLIGSLLILDTTNLFQFSVSQPLIICALLGIYFGDIPLGLHVGIYLELVWLSSLPVGAAVIPEGNMAAIISAVMVFRYHQNMELFHSVLILAVLYGLLMSFVGAELMVVYRKYNVILLNKLTSQLQKGKIASLPLTILSSLTLHTVILTLLISAGLFCGDLSFEKIALLPPEIENYANFGAIGILAAGTGLLLHLYKGKISRVLILAGAVIGLIMPII